MAQQLKTLVALAQDQDSVPSTYMVAHSKSILQFQGIQLQHPSLTPNGTRHTRCTDIHAGKALINKKKNLNKQINKVKAITSQGFYKGFWKEEESNSLRKLSTTWVLSWARGEATPWDDALLQKGLSLF